MRASWSNINTGTWIASHGNDMVMAPRCLGKKLKKARCGKRNEESGVMLSQVALRASQPPPEPAAASC